MVVLALDTVSRAGSLALLERDALLERVGDASRTHGERLPAELLDLLAERGLTPAAREAPPSQSSQRSTSMRQVLHACPGEVGVMKRLDVRMLTQPARSGECPLAPVGT